MPPRAARVPNVDAAPMTHWLDPVRAALGARDRPFELFVRDDDGGWDDAALLALIDTCAEVDAVVDVAVIPNALHDGLAALLNDCVEAGVARVHQHGRAHTNHESEGRKCEFGAARSYSEQLSDIAGGQAKLRAAFGDRFDLVFTPPWNRCVEVTADALVACGIGVLSRDSTAVPFARDDLVEVPVTIDWMAKRDAGWTPEQLGQRLAGGIATSEAVGLMLHHAVTDAAERGRIAEFLALVRPCAHPTTIARLAAD